MMMNSPVLFENTEFRHGGCCPYEPGATRGEIVLGTQRVQPMIWVDPDVSVLAAYTYQCERCRAVKYWSPVIPEGVPFDSSDARLQHAGSAIAYLQVAIFNLGGPESYVIVEMIEDYIDLPGWVPRFSTEVAEVPTTAVSLAS